MGSAAAPRSIPTRQAGLQAGRRQPQSEIPNRQGAKNAIDEMAHWEGTNESSESPIPVFSSSSVQRPEYRILGDLGVMAVQGFSRIRVN
jgi:hypothetical protein